MNNSLALPTTIAPAASETTPGHTSQLRSQSSHPGIVVPLEALIVLTASLLAAVMLHWYGMPYFNTRYFGGASRDAGLYLWLVENATDSLSVTNWFTTHAFYPYGKSLAWSDSFVVPSLLYRGLTFLGVSSFAAFNSLLLLLSTLNGVCSYYCSRSLWKDSFAALVSGISFMSLGYFVSQQGHPQLQCAFFLPLALLFTAKVFFSGGEKNGFLLSATIAAAFLTAVYFAIFSVLLALFFYLCLTLTTKRLLPEGGVLAPLKGGLLPALFLVPFVLPYLATRDAFGGRNLYEAKAFAASPLAYLSHGPYSLMYNRTSDWVSPELWLGMGVVLLGFLAWYSATHLRSWRRLFAASVVLGYTLCLVLPEEIQAAPFIKIIKSLFLWGIPTAFLWELWHSHNQQKVLPKAIVTLAIASIVASFGPLEASLDEVTIPTPFTFLFSLVPGMEGIRVPARLGIIAMLCATLLLGHFVSQIKGSVSKGFLGTLLLVGVVFENYIVLFPVEALPAAPQVIDSLALHLDNDDAAIVLPLTDSLRGDGRVNSWSQFAFHSTNAMNWLDDLEGHLVNGYSGQRTVLTDAYPRKLSGFPDARSITALSLIPNLRFILVQTKYMTPKQREALPAGLSLYKEQLEILDEGADGSLLFEFTPLTTGITAKSYLLRVPSYETGSLKLNLRLSDAPHRKCNTSLISVSRETPEGVAIMPPLSLSSNGEWSIKTISLAADKGGVVPSIVRFEAAEGCTLDMRERRWQPL